MTLSLLFIILVSDIALVRELQP